MRLFHTRLLTRAFAHSRNPLQVVHPRPGWWCYFNNSRPNASCTYDPDNNPLGCNCFWDKETAAVATVHVYKCKPETACLGRDTAPGVSQKSTRCAPELGCNHSAGYADSVLCSRCLPGYVKDLKKGSCSRYVLRPTKILVSPVPYKLLCVQESECMRASLQTVLCSYHLYTFSLC